MPTAPPARLRPALAVLVALMALAGRPAAQPAVPDRVPASDAAFEEGLAAYQAGDYAAAERLFTRAATEYGYTERTTAATLMAAKAAYAAGDPERAASAATRLVSRYPASRYAADARALLPRVAESAQGQVFDLGIVLPVGGERGYLGQALFNGVRIAVDEHNARVAGGGAGRRVRMVFRDSEGTGPGAAEAVAAVVAAGADAVVGPLFSDEAEPAGAAAEAADVTLLAPLATDQAVSQGRQFVFQANPTFPARGRAMARYAVGRLGLGRLGTASRSGALSADMAGAFATEVRRLGASVAFEEGLENASAWEDLDREIGEAALRSVQAIYLPVTGGDAPRYASDALRALDALGSLGRTPRPLGNTEWEGLAPSAADRATRLGAVFTQDFFVAPGATDAFGARYRALAGIPVDRLALIGYDLTRFLLAQVGGGGEGSLADRVRAAPRFDGVAHRFAFDGGQVNEALFILGYRDGRSVLLE
ncbi:ABC transporter substrate-binding protein [Rubrivirga sp. S365]|uniref:ABC transporter substrate-binding protein n=1 Tax=Rubrivirga litoralis TaxID=3075598 RepID=A0ABU3BNY2_9BACT|nr:MULTISPECIES: ABC transporter substrate-binding protein [unclassified Rubrivirga]MDT0631004.1 ABC transporter substrate-binding protein [Rubrivirga sp. F394]MDT7855030.1 ABC transporter substrate-binding protein [Rubrivirga sp. S365]